MRRSVALAIGLLVTTGVMFACSSGDEVAPIETCADLAATQPGDRVEELTIRPVVLIAVEAADGRELPDGTGMEIVVGRRGVTGGFGMKLPVRITDDTTVEDVVIRGFEVTDRTPLEIDYADRTSVAVGDASTDTTPFYPGFVDAPKLGIYEIEVETPDGKWSSRLGLCRTTSVTF